MLGAQARHAGDRRERRLACAGVEEAHMFDAAGVLDDECVRVVHRDVLVDDRGPVSWDSTGHNPSGLWPETYCGKMNS